MRLLLVGVGIIGFPLLFETQPRPIAVDIPIEIPARDKVPPLKLPPAEAAPPRRRARPAAGGRRSRRRRPQPAPPAAPAVPPACGRAAGRAAAAPPSRAGLGAPGPPRRAAGPPRPRRSAPRHCSTASRSRRRHAGGRRVANAEAARFVVQVGAYTDAAALREARQKVEKLGLKTYTQVVETDAGTRTRVRVGPFDTREEADKAAARIKGSGLAGQRAERCDGARLGWVDLAMLGGAGCCRWWLGLWRGFVFEALALVGWVVAYFAAQWLAPQWAPHLPLGEPGSSLNYARRLRAGLRGRARSAGALAVARCCACWSMPRRCAVLDRVLGAAFGLLRGVLLLLVLATVVALTPAARSAALAAVRRARNGWRVAMQGLKPLLPPRHRAVPARPEPRPPKDTDTMCGIVGAISKRPSTSCIYDALLLLQHRGQDAAGIVTMQGTKCFMHKARGMVRDVFRTRNMRALPGTWAWARCATRRPATPTARRRRSPSTSTRPSASCWCTTATSPTRRR